MFQNKKLVVSLAAIAVLAGAGVGLYGISSAQTADQNTAVAQTAAAQSDTGARQFDPTKGGHVGQNGVREELLTGDQADKAKAAALAAVPGGTIERVETDAEGDAFEAHMTKADGSHVTVKFDSNFNVTKTESGHGPGGMGTQTQ
jgi:hypothetical protein